MRVAVVCGASRKVVSVTGRSIKRGAPNAFEEGPGVQLSTGVRWSRTAHLGSRLMQSCGVNARRIGRVSGILYRAASRRGRSAVDVPIMVCALAVLDGCGMGKWGHNQGQA